MNGSLTLSRASGAITFAVDIRDARNGESLYAARLFTSANGTSAPVGGRAVVGDWRRIASNERITRIRHRPVFV